MANSGEVKIIADTKSNTQGAEQAAALAPAPSGNGVEITAAGAAEAKLPGTEGVVKTEGEQAQPKAEPLTPQAQPQEKQEQVPAAAPPKVLTLEDLFNQVPAEEEITVQTPFKRYLGLWTSILPIQIRANGSRILYRKEGKIAELSEGEKQKIHYAPINDAVALSRLRREATALVYEFIKYDAQTAIVTCKLGGRELTSEFNKKLKRYMVEGKPTSAAVTADFALGALDAVIDKFDELDKKHDEELEKLTKALKGWYALLTPAISSLDKVLSPEEKKALQDAPTDADYCNTAIGLVAKYAPKAAEAGKFQEGLATAQRNATESQQTLDSFGGAEKLAALKKFDEEREQIIARLNAAERTAETYKNLPKPEEISAILAQSAANATDCKTLRERLKTMEAQQAARDKVPKSVCIKIGADEVPVPEKYVDIVRQQLVIAARATELENAGYKTPQDVAAALAKATKKLGERAAGLEQALEIYRAIDADPSALQKKVTEYDATKAQLEADLDAARGALESYEQTGLKASEVLHIAGANASLIMRIKELSAQSAAPPAQASVPATGTSTPAQKPAEPPKLSEAFALLGTRKVHGSEFITTKRPGSDAPFEYRLGGPRGDRIILLDGSCPSTGADYAALAELYKKASAAGK